MSTILWKDRVEQPVEGNCQALRFMGDPTTGYRCALPEGHDGKHHWSSDDDEWAMQWSWDGRENCSVHGIQDWDYCTVCAAQQSAWDAEFRTGTWVAFLIPEERWASEVPLHIIVILTEFRQGQHRKVQPLKHPEHGWFLVSQWEDGTANLLCYPVDLGSKE